MAIKFFSRFQARKQRRRSPGLQRRPAASPPRPAGHQPDAAGVREAGLEVVSRPAAAAPSRDPEASQRDPASAAGRARHQLQRLHQELCPQGKPRLK